MQITTSMNCPHKKRVEKLLEKKITTQQQQLFENEKLSLIY